jgi:hypothetical protein
VHVTLRVRSGLPSLRSPGAHRIVLAALAAGSARAAFRVVHYSAQTNHLHLVCEAAHRRALLGGIRGLCVRLARRLNRHWARRGRVLADRPHVRGLRTPREVRNALAYVLLNAAHHGIHTGAWLDPCSSARWFEGWTPPADGSNGPHPPLPSARTWLLSVGWRRHGLLPRDTQTAAPTPDPPRGTKRRRP